MFIEIRSAIIKKIKFSENKSIIIAMHIHLQKANIVYFIHTYLDKL